MARAIVRKICRGRVLRIGRLLRDRGETLSDLQIRAAHYGA